MADDGRLYTSHTSGWVNSSALPDAKNLNNFFPTAEESFQKYRSLSTTNEQSLAGTLDIQVDQNVYLAWSIIRW